MENYFLMVTSFLPSLLLSEDEGMKEYVIDIMTNNQVLFKNVSDLVGH